MLGTIQYFNDSLDKWSKYDEKFSNCVEINEIEDSKLSKTLLVEVGSKTFSLFKTLTNGIDPTKMPLLELKEILDHHYHPRPMVVPER